MLKELFQDYQKNLNFFFNQIDFNKAEEMLQLFLNCQGMLIFTGVGKSGIIAEKLAMTMISTGTKALYLPPMKRLQNRDNIDGLLYRRALVNAVCGLSKTELLQYAEWLEQDVFTAIDQRRDIRGAMSTIKTPVLLVTGPHDELAPADAVEATRDLLDAVDDKKLLIASRMAGMSTNYGHLDLLLGQPFIRARV